MVDFLVNPDSMVWPQILPEVALFTSFHSKNESFKSSTMKMSRMSWFWLVFTAVFVYTWIPQYIAISAQLITFACFFTSNRTIRFLSSGDTFEGPGIFALTLDWSVFDHHNPLSAPFWASCNFFANSIIWGWIISPLVFYTNVFNSPVLQSRYGWDGANKTVDPVPVMNSNLLYDR